MVVSEDNVAHFLERRLSPQVLHLLRTVASVAQRQGVAAYLVGGPVRDLFLSRPTTDLDIATEGDAVSLGHALAKELGGRVRATSQFGTIQLDVLGLRVDLAHTRREHYARPGALPRVEPSDITHDLERRDFTINAMAVALHDQAWGDLYKVPHSTQDIAAGILRVLHDRSFQDDATRMLRAVRYEQRLDFRLHPATEALLRHDAALLDAISGARVRRELALLLQEPRPAACLRRAQELGLLQAIHPTLRLDSATLQALAATPTGTSSLVLWAALVHSATPAELTSLHRRLALPRTWTRVAQDVLALGERVHKLDDPSLRPSQAYRLLVGLDQHAVQAWALLRHGTPAGGWLRRYLEELRHVKPALDGNGLRALGVPQGPDLGALLEELRDARLDGTLSSRQDDEDYVRRWLHQGSAPDP